MISYKPQSNKITIKASVGPAIKNTCYQIRVRTTIHSLLGMMWLKNSIITLLSGKQKSKKVS